MYTLFHQVLFNVSENDKIMLFEPGQPPISQRLSVMQNWLQANCSGFVETLHIWTYWNSASRLSYLGYRAGKAP